MGFLGFILFILIIVFVVLPVMLLSRLFGGLSGLFRRQQDDNSFFYHSRNTGREGKETTRKRRRKIFDRTDGEYVEFEEIIEERDINVDGGSRRCETEEQVSDAEWTEVK